MILFQLRNIYLKASQYKKIWLSVSVILAGLFLFISTRSTYQLRESGYPDISILFDAMNHFTGFSILSISLRLYFEKNNKNKKITNKQSLIVIFIVCFWGILCETMQFFIPSRGVELIDYTANILAAPLIQLAINAVLKRSSP